MKDITVKFTRRWSTFLAKTIEDPDSLWEDALGELVEELITRNSIVFNPHYRDPWFWVS